LKTGKITPLVLALTLVGMLLLGFSNDLIGIDIGGFSDEDTPGVERILPTDQTEPGDSIPVFISPNDVDSYYAVKEDFGGLIFMHQHTADNYSEDAFIMIGPDQFFYILTVPDNATNGTTYTITGTYWTDPENVLDIGPSTVTVIVNETGDEIVDFDEDGDGIIDDDDDCPGTLNGHEVDQNGCAESQKDDDQDGIMNDVDACPGTFVGSVVNANGCASGETPLDTDGDGVIDIDDNCRNKANPGQQDSDNDGIGDACEKSSTTVGEPTTPPWGLINIVIVVLVALAIFLRFWTTR